MVTHNMLIQTQNMQPTMALVVFIVQTRLDTLRFPCFSTQKLDTHTIGYTETLEQ
jgi:hypothetical protein